jgi:hypothetical protein
LLFEKRCKITAFFNTMNKIFKKFLQIDNQ